MKEVPLLGGKERGLGGDVGDGGVGAISQSPKKRTMSTPERADGLKKRFKGPPFLRKGKSLVAVLSFGPKSGGGKKRTQKRDRRGPTKRSPKHTALKKPLKRQGT